MDRFEAMKVFVTAAEEGSLAAASRRLKRSPAAAAPSPPLRATSEPSSCIAPPAC